MFRRWTARYKNRNSLTASTQLHLKAGIQLMYMHDFVWEVDAECNKNADVPNTARIFSLPYNEIYPF